MVGLLPVEKRVSQLKLGHVYNIFHSNASVYMKSNFHISNSRTRNSVYNFNITRDGSSSKDSFYYTGAKLWKDLPLSVHRLISRTTTGSSPGLPQAHLPDYHRLISRTTTGSSPGLPQAHLPDYHRLRLISRTTTGSSPGLPQAHLPDYHRLISRTTTGSSPGLPQVHLPDYHRLTSRTTTGSSPGLPQAHLPDSSAGLPQAHLPDSKRSVHYSAMIILYDFGAVVYFFIHSWVLVNIGCVTCICNV